MRYQGKEIEIVSQKHIFGKAVAEIRVLASGELKSVPVTELEESVSNSSDSEISFKAIAAKIKSEVQAQSLLAPYESNIIPLPANNGVGVVYVEYGFKRYPVHRIHLDR